MRIVLDTFALTRPRTGIGIYTEQLTRHLLRIDRENEYIFYYGKFFSRRIFVGGEEPRIDLDGGGSGFLAGQGKYRQVLKDMYFFMGATLKRCHLYHELHSFPLPFLGRTVLTVHDLSLSLFPETHPRERASLWRAEFGRRLRRVDRIIAISENTKRDLVEIYDVEPEKIAVIYYGCRSIFKPLGRDITEAALRERGLDFPYILYVGAIEPRKNILRLIEAFRSLKEGSAIPHKLVLAGPLAWKSDGIIRGMVERDIPYYVQGRGRRDELAAAEVIITGYIPNELLPPLINGADLFVYPSLYEGFGLPPLEAMACGTPVITSDASSLPEVVGKAGVMVPPEDTERLSSEMHRVLSDEELRRSLGEKGIRQAARFSWQVCAEKVLQVYGEVSEV